MDLTKKEMLEWVQDSERTIEDLSTFSLGKAVALCCNGSSMRGETYLIQAGVQLGMAKGTQVASSMQADILDALKKTAGIEVVRFAAMDEAYFGKV